MDNNILCHIVGINNLLKSQFIKELNNKYYNLFFCDLDIITNNIRNGRKMVNLVNKIENTKKNPSKRKELVKELNDYWKTTFERRLKLTLSKNKDKIVIMLGLCTFHRNHRIKINIDTNKKFFLKNNVKTNAKEIVEYNLKKYKKYIIDGIFPIKYIDHEFLIKQREKLINVYKRMNYIMKTYPTLMKWFELTLKDQEKPSKQPKMMGGYNVNSLLITESTTRSKPVWVGHSQHYYDIIDIEETTDEPKKAVRKSRQKIESLIKNKSNVNIKENNISGYKDQWLALLSILKNNNRLFRKGYIENKKDSSTPTPYIQEKVLGAIDYLKTDGYLYEAKRADFDTKVSVYKYKSSKPIPFVDVKKIDNIYDKLINLGVKIIKLK